MSHIAHTLLRDAGERDGRKIGTGNFERRDKGRQTFYGGEYTRF